MWQCAGAVYIVARTSVGLKRAAAREAFLPRAVLFLHGY